ncbi:phospholipase A [Sulfurimonas sediminis]|uniref:Phosphatidylcholine 1-acylhydrolase n=2 Tax=Sulfurimonas sediminis TaxID=2590020 RepID=A0A7M1B4Q8_9BACT|nr:phospholipase A [Sulfurimonas sediminis]
MKVFIFLYIVLGLGYLQASEEIDATKSKINIENITNDTSKENMQKWLDNSFGLHPYKANYILPFGIANKTYINRKLELVKYKKYEAELQVSLQLEVYKNLFGLGEKYSLAYTQQAFWQLYVTSSPFRENLYNPEAFVVFPISDKTSIFQMRSVKFALAHKSNGLPDTGDIQEFNGFNLSKSINYFYTTLRLQHTTLITDLTFLAPLPGSANLSDNPDIMKYLGYTKVKFTYFYHKHMLSLMLRGNIDSLRGTFLATYSYPLRRDKSYLYIKFFSGYMESLIDYNQNITKLSIGFSFSR